MRLIRAGDYNSIDFAAVDHCHWIGLRVGGTCHISNRLGPSCVGVADVSQAHSRNLRCEYGRMVSAHDPCTYQAQSYRHVMHSNGLISL